VTSRSQRGAVTAELAMAIPMLVAVTLGLVWLLSLGTAQLRMVDATREAARAIARGDSPDEAVARAEPVAPDGSTLSVTTAAGQVVVTGTATVDGVGGLFAFLPQVHVNARAVAAAEEPP
jgi:Flp pilus assembly protein TadG